MERGQVKKYFTQNIDGLEIDAGADPALVLQAHGNIKSASCSNSECKKKIDVALVKQKVLEGGVEYCDQCQAPVKPDVVLFGEKLSVNLISEISNLKSADLVFIMGTSLKVFPFNALVEFIPASTPVVILNFENPLSSKSKSFSKFLFLQGDIDVNVSKPLEVLN